ncbi:MAG: hypothetical protein WAX69_11665 [Victivallales bacterium]
MNREIENLNRKVDSIYNLLLRRGASASLPAEPIDWHNRETELEKAIRKAIGELEMTKTSFKSKQIMRIKDELARVVERKK